MRRALAGVIAAAALAVCCPAAASASAAWAVKPVPLRAGETHAGLSGVFCASVISCTAVGQEFLGSGAAGLALAEHWNGSTWSPKPTAEPAGAADSSLSGVSCVTGVTCTAVGSYVNAAGVLLTLAENWNGDAWMVQQSPSPGGANGSELPVLSYAGLGKLPASPRAASRYLASLPGAGTGPAPQREFYAIGSLLSSYLMPPRLTAELYRALGDIPAVTLDRRAVDVAGRHGAGFSLQSGSPGRTEEIVINPRTFQLMGLTILGPRHRVLGGTAFLRQVPVPRPGTTPSGPAVGQASLSLPATRGDLMQATA